MTAASDGPIAAFAVDDLLEARAELEMAGTEMVRDLIWASDEFADPALDGFGRFSFRAPDGNVCVLQSGPIGRRAGPGINGAPGRATAAIRSSGSTSSAR